jgi:nucleotide-binding universal stress UspA family protein
MIKRILVGVAGTPALPSKIECAIDLAQRHDAEIGVLSVVDVDRLAKVGPVPLGAGHYAWRLREKRIERSHSLDENAIARFEEACKAANVPLHVIRSEKDPLKALTQLTRYYDLCVLGARGWFDYQVMPEPRNALLSVVAGGVRPILAITEGMDPVRRAVIGYNGSIESARTMKHFIQLALWPEMELHIVCVGSPKTGERREDLIDAAAACARAHGFDPILAHCEGDPAKALHEYAVGVNAGIIAIGSSCRRVLLNRRFGKNVRTLLETSDLPLFLCN